MTRDVHNRLYDVLGNYTSAAYHVVEIDAGHEVTP